MVVRVSPFESVGPRSVLSSPLAAPSVPVRYLKTLLQGKVAYTGVNFSARRPLASVRKVTPVSNLMILLLLQTIKVKRDWIR